MSIHADLTASPRAAGQARALVASVLSGPAICAWHEETVHTAQLIVSELVTNAVLHARTDLHLGVCHDEHTLLIAVTDGAPPIGESSAAGPSLEAADESGRGMLIVATLAADFGWQQRDDMPGKIMWASLDLDGAADVR